MVIALEEKKKGIELQINNVKVKSSKLVDLKLINEISGDIYNSKREDMAIEL
ncbi:MAG: hypothetical protein GWO79_00725 [Actinobacteria bacterium]|nr:hypothetical protein [Actinomycetota bacterium]